MDADPDVDVTIRRQTEVCLGKLRLRLYGALNCVNNADELRQHAVPSRVSDPAPVGRNQSIKNGAPLGQGLEGCDFVGPHQATVPLDVGRENSDQPSLGIDRLCHHTPLEPAKELIAEKSGTTPERAWPTPFCRTGRPRLVGVKSVVFCKRRLPVNFRYALLSGEIGAAVQ